MRGVPHTSEGTAQLGTQGVGNGEDMLSGHRRLFSAEELEGGKHRFYLHAPILPPSLPLCLFPSFPLSLPPAPLLFPHPPSLTSTRALSAPPRAAWRCCIRSRAAAVRT